MKLLAVIIFTVIPSTKYIKDSNHLGNILPNPDRTVQFNLDVICKCLFVITLVLSNPP